VQDQELHVAAARSKPDLLDLENIFVLFLQKCFNRFVFNGNVFLTGTQPPLEIALESKLK
jgi:hypothetical protein